MASLSVPRTMHCLYLFRLPDPSLSISDIIFFISSFFGSKPSALIATYKVEKHHHLNKIVRWWCLYKKETSHKLVSTIVWQGFTNRPFDPDLSTRQHQYRKRYSLTLSISYTIGELIRDYVAAKITMENRLPHTFNSFASIVPEPSTSNKSKASLISCFCSSVSSGLGPAFFLVPPPTFGFLYDCE